MGTPDGRPCGRCTHSSYCEGIARQNCLTGDYFDFRERGPDLAKRVASRVASLFDIPGLTSVPVPTPDAPVAVIDVEWLRAMDRKLDAILAALQQQKERK